jgi:dethiobiotin synthetase
LRRIVITGTGPDVGKTIVSAIVAESLGAEYWKPVQCGCDDTETVRALTKSTCHPVNYHLKAPFSPHYAAKLEGLQITHLQQPETNSTLVIETAGGIYAPLNDQTLLLDVFQSWGAEWIVVVSFYVGCINHALLTIEALQRRNLPILGLIFNGSPQPHMEEAILHFSKLSCLGNLLPEKKLDSETIQRYAGTWNLSKKI